MKRSHKGLLLLLLSLPFLVLVVLLYLTGREMILANKKSPTVD